MKTTIDRAGRVVIPKRIREAAQLKPGIELEVQLVQGVVQLEPVTEEVRLEKRGHLTVAVPRKQRQALSRKQVETTLSEVRAERGNRAAKGSRKE